MGNIIESDSSISDIENSENTKSPLVRTEGDGMESNINPPNAAVNISGCESSMQTKMAISTKDNFNKNGNIPGKASYQVPDKAIDVLTPINLVTIKTVLSHHTSATKSPRELPSRDLLIPVKPPPKLENSIGAKSSTLTSYDKLNVGVCSKQKNPKFVPYEPYSCATRPIIKNTQTHVRKPSDSSSVTSHTSTVSTSEQIKDIANPEALKNTGTSSPKAEQNLASSSSSTSRHHASTTLLKERLRMAEKEISDLQSENARLKKLLIDSIVGPKGSDPSVQNVNSHGITESFDNLNDELEVSRSKFLSSCVLVEQLTKENHDMNVTISRAAEIIKDLKNAANLTQHQYETINDWLRKTNNVLYLSTLPDSNFNNEEYLENSS